MKPNWNFSSTAVADLTVKYREAISKFKSKIPIISLSKNDNTIPDLQHNMATDPRFRSHQEVFDGSGPNLLPPNLYFTEHPELKISTANNLDSLHAETEKKLVDLLNYVQPYEKSRADTAKAIMEMRCTMIGISQANDKQGDLLLQAILEMGETIENSKVSSNTRMDALEDWVKQKLNVLNGNHPEQQYSQIVEIVNKLKSEIKLTDERHDEFGKHIKADIQSKADAKEVEDLRKLMTAFQSEASHSKTTPSGKTLPNLEEEHQKVKANIYTLSSRYDAEIKSLHQKLNHAMAQGTTPQKNHSGNSELQDMERKFKTQLSETADSLAQQFQDRLKEVQTAQTSMLAQYVSDIERLNRENTNLRDKMREERRARRTLQATVDRLSKTQQCTESKLLEEMALLKTENEGLRELVEVTKAAQKVSDSNLLGVANKFERLEKDFGCVVGIVARLDGENKSLERLVRDVISEDALRAKDAGSLITPTSSRNSISTLRNSVATYLTNSPNVTAETKAPPTATPQPFFSNGNLAKSSDQSFNISSNTSNRPAPISGPPSIPTTTPSTSQGTSRAPLSPPSKTNSSPPIAVVTPLGLQLPINNSSASAAVRAPSPVFVPSYTNTNNYFTQPNTPPYTYFIPASQNLYPHNGASYHQMQIQAQLPTYSSPTNTHASASNEHPPHTLSSYITGRSQSTALNTGTPSFTNSTSSNSHHGTKSGFVGWLLSGGTKKRQSSDV
ncbi:hypothetical protein HDU76_002852 [Blyttiomyces sp. JEL0837]|nr:hypothetical protein HDU76_002852 [Blyttiomyces sp. JEL0837]